MSFRKCLFVTCLSVLALADGCIERINIDTPESALPLVVDGGITNEPGPYQVRLSRANNVQGYLGAIVKPFFAKQVTIFDDKGNSEILNLVYNGVYQTSTFQGVAGNQYFIRIEARDGKVYESIPETIKASGTVDSIYYQFDITQPENAPTKYGFRIFADFSGYPQGENLFRWQFRGTYKVETRPELRTQPAGEGRVPDPPPCSGWVYNIRTRVLNQVGPCECCECWSSLYEQTPLISDNSISLSGQFKNIEVGYVPVDYWEFYDKTMITVKQLSISPTEFNYWKLVRQQLVGSSSVFQPVTGKAKSNIFVKNGSEEVLGFFTVAGVSKKVLFMNRNNLPQGYSNVIPQLDIPINESCLVVFKNSTNQRPTDWK